MRIGDLVTFAYRSLISSKTMNQNFATLRAGFETLESDFDGHIATMAAALGNCILYEEAPTVNGLTVSIPSVLAMVFGEQAGAGPVDVVLSTPVAGSYTAAIVVDGDPAVADDQRVRAIYGSTDTPDLPPMLSDYQSIVRTVRLNAGQASITLDDLSIAFTVYATDFDALDAARRSARYGDFASLDARLEAIENRIDGGFGSLESTTQFAIASTVFAKITTGTGAGNGSDLAVQVVARGQRAVLGFLILSVKADVATPVLIGLGVDGAAPTDAQAHRVIAGTDFEGVTIIRPFTLPAGTHTIEAYVRTESAGRTVTIAARTLQAIEV